MNKEWANTVISSYNKFRRAPLLLLLLALASLAASIYYAYLDFQNDQTFDELEKWCLAACKQENRPIKECIKEICSMSSATSVGFGVVAVLFAAGYAVIWAVMADSCLQVVKSFKE